MSDTFLVGWSINCSFIACNLQLGQIRYYFRIDSYPLFDRIILLLKSYPDIQQSIFF